MQLGGTGGDAGGRIGRHGFGRERKPGMEIASARAVETGLDDHVVSRRGPAFTPAVARLQRSRPDMRWCRHFRTRASRPGSLRRLHRNVAPGADDHGVAGGGTKLAHVKAFADFIDGESKAGLVRSGVLGNAGAALAAGALQIPCVMVSSRHHRIAVVADRASNRKGWSDVCDQAHMRPTRSFSDVLRRVARSD